MMFWFLLPLGLGLWRLETARHTWQIWCGFTLFSMGLAVWLVLIFTGRL